MRMKLEVPAQPDHLAFLTVYVRIGTVAIPNKSFFNNVERLHELVEFWIDQFGI